MMRRRLTLIAVTAALTLTGAANAGAATEIGSNCPANAGTGEYSLVQLEKSPANPLPVAAPAAGVITQWKVNIAVPIPGLGQRLQVLRPAGVANAYQVVAETEVRTVTLGQNAFPTRIPVQGGDQIGAASQGEAQAVLYCATPGGGTLGGHPGVAPVGATEAFPPLAEGIEVALAAVIEPDADGDGFGDETQDKCPQAASTQVECPVIVLDSFPLAKKSSIVVLVAASESGSVSVSGTAKLPKAKKASSSAQAKLKKVTRTVTAGKIARFTLRLPGNLKAALKSLPKGKKVTVKLQATATNVAGQVSRDKAKLRLK
jgi:hypothetical protein